MIPAEAVEAAARAMHERKDGPFVAWDDVDKTTRRAFMGDARMALEAAAQHMVKRALNDALDDLEDIDPDNLRVWLRERADSIEPTP